MKLILIWTVLAFGYEMYDWYKNDPYDVCIVSREVCAAVTSPATFLSTRASSLITFIIVFLPSPDCHMPFSL